MRAIREKIEPAAKVSVMNMRGGRSNF